PWQHDEKPPERAIPASGAASFMLTGTHMRQPAAMRVGGREEVAADAVWLVHTLVTGFFLVAWALPWRWGGVGAAVGAPVVAVGVVERRGGVADRAGAMVGERQPLRAHHARAKAARGCPRRTGRTAELPRRSRTASDRASAHGRLREPRHLRGPLGRSVRGG